MIPPPRFPPPLDSLVFDEKPVRTPLKKPLSPKLPFIPELRVAPTFYYLAIVLMPLDDGFRIGCTAT